MYDTCRFTHICRNGLMSLKLYICCTFICTNIYGICAHNKVALICKFKFQ